MPISIEYEDSIYWIRFFGSITSADLMSVIEVFEESEGKHAVVPHRITDLSGVAGMQIGFEDVHALALQRRVKRFPNSFKSAIVACNEIQTGFSRMFQTLNSNPQITVRIFPNLQDAIEWIAPARKE